MGRTGFNVRVKAEFMGKSKTIYIPVCGVERNILKGKSAGVEELL